MTETSLCWSGTAVGDATIAPYTADRWSDMFRIMHLDNRAKSGVIRGHLNELAATGAASPISIDTGGAIVDGLLYQNDASVSFAIANPAVNPRIDRVVLRKSFAAQTVRLTVITGAEAAAPSKPAITQTDGVTWDIPLWYLWIDVGGNISIFDEYNWAHSPLGFDVGLQQGRISLVWDQSVITTDQGPATPASTSVANDTVTFAAARPWTTGQAIQVSATGNGLTINTLYYVYTADLLTYSFHTCLHDALFNQNLVNLTGNIQPNTLFSAALYLTRHNGDSYDVYDSTYGWTRLRIPDRGIMIDITNAASFPISTVFDIFVTEDGTLEHLAWASAILRATSVDKSGNNDGVWLKTGDQTRRLVATVFTNVAGGIYDRATTRNIANINNRVARYFYLLDATSHSYNGAIRLWNNNAAFVCRVVLPLDESQVFLNYGHDSRPTNTATCQVAVITDGNTATAASYGGQSATNSNAARASISCGFVYFQNPITTLGNGMHTLGMSELGTHANSTFDVMYIQGYILG